MIPKIIHQIWIQGYDSVPEQLKKYHENCKKINHDFEYIVWDDTMITNLLDSHFTPKYAETYHGYKIFAQKADFARYAILYVYGGIYLDMDMVCRKNLDPFLNYDLFFTKDAFYFLYRRYLNGIIGSLPKHPIFKYIFKNIFERKNNADNVTYSTGTRLFFDSVKQYMKDTNDTKVAIIDSKYLHPCQTYDKSDCPFTCQECFVAHTNHGSWQSGWTAIWNNHIAKNLKIILFVIILMIIIIIYLKWFRYRIKS